MVLAPAPERRGVSGTLHSASWYRVADLRPRLKSHAEVHRHHYRGELWYVLQDRASRRMYRFNPAAWQVIGLLDGERTVQAAWDLACDRLGDDAPTQDETIRLLGQLHSADLLQSEIAPDVDELLRRHVKQEKGKWWRNLRNPMSVRMPLIDPDRFLKRTEAAYRWMVGVGGLLLWLALVLAAGVAAASHWRELTENIADRMLAPGNLLGLLVIFPFVKIVHEFGHACAVRARGGEVHEMGVMLLVFLPVPYVDASASSAFRSKWQRFQVGGAGMMAELALASLAMFVWLAVEPGIIRAACFNVMLIAGISTVLFNGNPLLRYDGYYMLSDLLEIPNLSQRANRHLGYLVQRYAFGLRELQAPEATRGEKAWFVFYSITSFLYRQFITFAIILFVATQYFVIGVVLAIWAAASSLLWPLGKAIGHVAAGRNLRRHRTRAWAVTGAALAVVMLVLFALPFPVWTRTEGVLWVPEQSVLRAATEGFVARVEATPGAEVRAGDARSSKVMTARACSGSRARADPQVAHESRWASSISVPDARPVRAEVHTDTKIGASGAMPPASSAARTSGIETAMLDRSTSLNTAVVPSSRNSGSLGARVVTAPRASPSITDCIATASSPGTPTDTVAVPSPSEYTST